MSTQEMKGLNASAWHSGSHSNGEHAKLDAVIGATDLLFRLDRAGTILDLKAGTINDLLLQCEELIGKRIQNIPLKHISDQFRDAIQKVTTKHSVVSMEYSLDLRGEGQAYEARLVPLPDDEILAIIRNITDSKKAEEALSQAEAKYRSIFENACEGIFQTTPSGKFITVNPALARILGFASPEELIEQRTDIAHQGYVLPGRREEFKRLMAEHGTVSGFEYEAYRNDGSKVWVSVTARAIRDPQGRIQFYEGFFQDISGRKRADGLRLAQNRVLEMIATSAPLSETLLCLTSMVEAQSDGMLCSVCLLDHDGRHLHSGAAPSLPEGYTQALDGLCIGPAAGSCGTAAYRKECVIVADVLTDPLWANAREWGRQYGFRACWSMPIVAHDGQVLGTFAMYYREVRTPNAMETRMIEIAAQIAGIALERKRDEEKLQQSVSLLESTFQSTADGILVVDSEGRIVSFNQRFVSLWQIPQGVLDSRDDLAYLGHVLGQLKHPDRFLSKVRELYSQPEGESLDTLDFKDGRVFERYSCPQRLEGKPIGRVWSFRDVTERNRAENELFKSQQMLRTVLDTIPQRVFWKDRDSVYVGCNQPVAEDCGYSSPSELIGKSDYETHSAATADIYRADDQKVMETGRPKVNYEEPQMKADGSRGWLKTSKVPLRDKEGNVIGILGTYEDITERKHLEEQLRQVQKMEAFGQLAAGVAHDFNNILTIIQGNLSLLKAELATRNERSPSIDQSLKAAERAANLTRQLLTFSRRQPMQPRDLDLNEVVANMTKMLQRLIGEHIALEARYAPGGAPIQADPGMMEQVLMNLAVNSRDAMPKGGKLMIETAFRIINEAETLVAPRRRAGEFIELSVSDSGSGIAPEHLSHIFEPFFTTKEIGKGTGLGLATVFGIVDQHHGWIEVESAPARGTTFRMFIPRLAQQAAAALAEASPAFDVRGGNETVLLVEDEEAVRELMQALLTQHGYRVHQATSGLAALKVWSEYRATIDLVVTDMVMPDGLGGRELAERLSSEKPGLKVIYCSGYTDEALGTDSPLRNTENFLEKPFSPQKFLQRIRDSLDGKQL